MREEIIIKKEIIPKIMYYQNKMYDIIFTDPSLIIKEYKIILNKLKIESLKLFNSHPNCNPNTNEFCLPNSVIGKEFVYIKDMINYLLSVYNLESCYFNPWGLIKYKER